MKKRIIPVATVVALSLFLWASVPAARAQSNAPLSEKEAKKLLATGETALKKAEQATARGNTAAAQEHARGFTTAFEQLERALEQDNVREDDVLDVAARVDEATLKHIPVLEGLLTRVPEQARPAIERALSVSRRGHDTATEAILRRGGVDLPGGVLTDRSARGAMQRNEALLKHAERAQRHADQRGVDRSVEKFTANMDVIGRAIENGAVDQSEAVSVFERVDRSTRRHVGILEDLLGQVPEQARPAIERAIQMSQRGNLAATEALSRTPAAGIQAGRPGAAGAPDGIGGGPGGAGRGGPQGGRPGPPSGKPGGRPPH